MFDRVVFPIDVLLAYRRGMIFQCSGSSTFFQTTTNETDLIARQLRDFPPSWGGGVILKISHTVGMISTI